jgi:hypothetical protein
MHGVTEGSIFGPMLFLLYINDLPLNILELNIVLFADDTSILVSRENSNTIQSRLNNVMKDIQTWFSLNILIVNVEKTLAISFHTTQNKKPALLHVLFEGRGIPYNTNTKFMGVYINENVKWINHIRYLSSRLNTSLYIISSLKNVMSAHVLRTMYFVCFHVRLRYSMTLWGSDLESIKIFRLQKKVVRLMGKVGQPITCRNLFKDLNILPLPCLYTWCV